MNKKKKWISVLLILAMLLTVCTPVGAAADCSIKITSTADGHTYEAYQIFQGDLAGNVLSNITWGNGLTEAGKSALKKVYGDTPEAIAKKIATENNAVKVGEVLNKSAYFATAAKSKKVDGGYAITGLNPGYYLVKDKDGSVTGHDAYTKYMVQVLGTATLSPKSSVPTVQKKVKDTNDSTGETTDWQDSADYDIGDTIPYQLKATLGDSVESYKTYKVVFHDTLSDGLTYQKITSVTVAGNTLSTSDYSATCEGGKLTVTINDVLTHNAKNGSAVVVEYTAKLNEKAEIGAAGNPNEVYLEFSNNPNDVPNDAVEDSTGTTAKDKVTVFTYKLSVNKVDGEKKPLKGAGFTLQKKVDGSYVEVGEEVKGEDLTTFTWKGLDDGEYRLIESTVPAGFNKMADLEFTVRATHDMEDADPKLTGLTGGDIFSGEVSNGTLSGQIVNEAGSTLPETGGMGTTLFYVLGFAMVLGAGVLLVSRRRAN